MDKSKMTAEQWAKLLREHADMLTLIQDAPKKNDSDEYERWLERRETLLSKIKRFES